MTNIVNYLVTNPAGVALRSGSCPEDQLSYQKMDSSETVTVTGVLFNTEVSKPVLTYTTENPLVPVVTVQPKSLNNIKVNGVTQTEFTISANGTEEITFTGVGSDALVDITMPPGSDVANKVNELVTDHIITFTTTIPGTYSIDIDDTKTVSYKGVIHAI